MPVVVRILAAIVVVIVVGAVAFWLAPMTQPPSALRQSIAPMPEPAVVPAPMPKSAVMPVVEPAPPTPEATKPAPAAKPAPASLPNFLPVNYGRVWREQFMAGVLQLLRSEDADQNGLDPGDLDRLGKAAAVVSAASNLVGRVLKYDFDDDGVVARAEVEGAQAREIRGFGPQVAERRAQAVQRVMQADRDGDGAITLAEMLVPDSPPQRTLGGLRVTQLRSLLALDPNKDGRLTADELAGLAEGWFAALDADANGVLDEKETAVYRAALGPAPAAAAMAGCAMPRPAESDLIALFGAYEGGTLSNVSVAGLNTETSTLRVTIERGDQPVYLVLSAYDPMVWWIVGATERVSRVVLIAGRASKEGKPYAGVTGVAAERITFAPRQGCSLLPYKVEANGATARASLAGLFGRAPDVLAGSYSAEGVDLPSGKVSTDYGRPSMPAGFDPAEWRESLRYAPGGLKAIDARDVVSAVPAEPYDVLPQEAGLAQLLGNGSLVTLSNSNDFRITRPIARYPAGLNGAHSVRFLLSSGLPVPAGEAGHSCVISEDTGRPVYRGANCP